MYKTTDDSLVFTTDDAGYYQTLPAEFDLHEFYCLECGGQWRATDAEACPFCHSDDVHHTH